MLYDNPQWISDINTVIPIIKTELDVLSGHNVLITGGAGLVLSPIIDIIFRYNDITNAVTDPTRRITVLAAGRWLEEMTSRFGNKVERPDFIFITYDATKTDQVLDCKADYIIHGASNSNPTAIIKEPVETMVSNFLGMKFLLDYAKQAGTKRVLYISSSEVYGKKDDSEPFKENQYGSIDLLNPRNSYSIGKSAAETLGVSYSAEYGVESVFIRPGHIYGPTANPHDNHVSSAWAFQAARGEEIVMKSDGKQLRSYVYCLDTSSAVIKVLISGKNCHAYNISNPNSVIDIKTMGEILAKAGGVEMRMELPTDAEKKGFNPMSNSSLESTSLQALGWKGMFDAKTGFDHTVKILKDVYGY